MLFSLYLILIFQQVFSLLKYVAILFVYSKFLQITGEAVNTTSFQTITEHMVDLNGMPTRPTTTFKEEIDNIENIKPTSLKANVHALNKRNGITTPFSIDESLKEANIEQTQDPFVAQPNMTVQDLKQEKNKNEGKIFQLFQQQISLLRQNQKLQNRLNYK
ncbi:unnamed protein product [Mytilus coruscus]|uniref:Uncharacterized protein n=1 Tax=Mytilus coruscus TaxID=42192 RepID=A0A6J8BZN9_MYTCO|nr:unnamed protein product [Mytilus coruscus]